MNKFLRTKFHKSLQEHPSSVGSATALLQGKQGYSSLRRGVLIRFAVKFFSYNLLNSRKAKDFLQQATYKGSIQCVLNQEFLFFWFTSIEVQKRPVSVEVFAPTRLALQGSHVQRQYQKWNTLRSKSSTIKALLYTC
jgi:hypothetical protein